MSDPRVNDPAALSVIREGRREILQMVNSTDHQLITLKAKLEDHRREAKEYERKVRVASVKREALNQGLHQLAHAAHIAGENTRTVDPEQFARGYYTGDYQRGNRENHEYQVVAYREDGNIEVVDVDGAYPEPER